MQARKDQGSLRIVQGRGMKPGDSVVIDLELFQAGTEVRPPTLHSLTASHHLLRLDRSCPSAKDAVAATEPSPIPVAPQEAIEGAARKGYQIDTGKPGAVFLPGIIEVSDALGSVGDCGAVVLQCTALTRELRDVLHLPHALPWLTPTPQGMEGMESTEGENERSIPITFPQSWDSPPQFAGMTMDAKIKLKELFEFDPVPEGDEFAGEAPSSMQYCMRAVALAADITMDPDAVGHCLW